MGLGREAFFYWFYGERGKGKMGKRWRWMLKATTARKKRENFPHKR